MGADLQAWCTLPSVTFEEVLEQGIFFGWSESKRRRFDESAYLQRRALLLTPIGKYEGATVIPTMILFGLCFGRWWRTTLVAAAVIWPLILVTNDVIGLEWGLLSAAALAVANTVVGVLAHQAFLWAVRHMRCERSPV